MYNRYKRINQAYMTCKYLLSVGVSKTHKVGGLPDTDNSLQIKVLNLLSECVKVSSHTLQRFLSRARSTQQKDPSDRVLESHTVSFVLLCT